ncbi:MAG: aldehyde dehydrogenase family protein, partial [Myxococcota bacterium]
MASSETANNGKTTNPAGNGHSQIAYDIADSAGGESIEVRNPSTGEVIGKVPVHTPAQVAETVARARGAAGRWGAMSFAARKRDLDLWRRALAERADELAELIHR